MSDELSKLLIIPLPADEAAEAKERALVDIGFYEQTAPHTWRLTEAGYGWIVGWLPRVIPLLISRSRAPEVERLIKLEWENLGLRVQVEELRRGILSPHRTTQAGDEEECAHSRRAGRPRLMDDAALAEAYRHHLSGLKLNCVGRYYGVSSHYLSAAFGRKGWPVRNYSHKGVRRRWRPTPTGIHREI